MKRRRTDEPRVFFTWEKRHRRLEVLSRRNAVAGVIAALAVAGTSTLVRTEFRRRSVHATRAAIANTIEAVDSFRADHDGRCPSSVDELLSPGGGQSPYLARVPRDGWGRALRLTCPGRKHAESADVVSGGPDGDFEGNEQVE